MRNKDRLICFFENCYLALKYNGLIKGTLVICHILYARFFLGKNAKSHDFLGYRMHFNNKQSLLNMLYEFFAGSYYYFKSKNNSPVIFDVGANIGDSSLYFMWLYPNSKIFAFEPHPEAYALLKQNMDTNKLADVECFQFALGKEKAQITLYSDSDGIYNESTAAMENSGARTYTVNVEKLSENDRYVNADRIDLLKIDVEGMEGEIIEDLRTSLGKVDKLIIEYHLTSDLARNSFDRMLSTLKDAGFEIGVESFYRDAENIPNNKVFILVASRP